MDITNLKRSLCTCQECQSGSYVLKETDKSATLKEITLFDIPDNSLVIKMDKVRFSNFFLEKKEWGYNKHSDYLLVTTDKLVFIEMKSKDSVSLELSEQCEQKFNSDTITLSLADMIIERMMNLHSFFKNREIHYVLFYQALSIMKTPTSYVMPSSNITVSTFRSIPVQNGASISYFRTI